MKIESADLSVESLLTGNYFTIPRFQRPYSWEEENIEEFWSDVTENSTPDYFIGSMVVYRQDKNTLGVVDGQQRLTTIMVFLCALRNAFYELEDSDKGDGLHGFIERKNKDNKDMFVLQTESSFPFLQDTILKKGEPDLDCVPGREEQALAKANAIFHQNIKEKFATIDNDPTVRKSRRVRKKIAWLTEAREAVLGLSIILVTLDNEDDAYLIFETLNTRGKDLALSDLVKNLFARNLRARGDIDQVTLKWNQVLETIFNSAADLSPDDFIVHSWQSRFEAVTKAKAYPRIRETITNRNATDHLNDFIFDAECYRRIFEPSYRWTKNQSAVQQSLEAFGLFKVVQPTPAVLSLVRAYQKKKIRLKALKRALLAIENFHFSFTAVTSSRSSGGISAMYSSFGRKLFDATDTNVASEEIRSFVKKLKEREPVSSEFDAGFEQIIYTNSTTSQRALVRYILMKISSHENLPQLGTSSELTIEHLVPQEQIGNKWPEDIVGQIGNLILVDEKTNEQLGTKSFSEKKKILLERGYQIPEEFVNQRTLNHKLIVKRTTNISRKAREEIWKVS